MRPVVFDVVRVITEPFEIGGYTVPAGWYLAPGIAAIHHLEAEWPDPWSYRPERFADERPNLRAWMPFGGGKRFCVGSHLALMEMRIILGEVLSRVSVRVEDLAGARERALRLFERARVPQRVGPEAEAVRIVDGAGREAFRRSRFDAAD